MSPKATPVPNEAALNQLKRDLAAQGLIRCTVVSGSMMPVIPVGGTVVVASVDPEQLRVFDIVVFWDGLQLICHYFWHRNYLPDPSDQDVIITRSLTGWEDKPVPVKRVLGRVENFRISFARRALLLLKARLKGPRRKIAGGAR